MVVRGAEVSDHPRVLAVADEWWGGRSVTGLAKRLFFEHFADTSLVAEDRRGLAGFLVGFLSQSRPDEAYIHMVGVRPDLRGSGLARDLYERFFAMARSRDRDVVTCITSPVNQGSIAFHTAMGFTAKLDPGHEGFDHDRIVFRRDLSLDVRRSPAIRDGEQDNREAADEGDCGDERGRRTGWDETGGAAGAVRGDQRRHR